MQSDNRSVAVALVTYNRKALLDRGLDAIFAQSCPVSVIVIVDNASTDGTAEGLLERGVISSIPIKSQNEPVESRSTFRLPNGFDIEIHYVLMHRNTGGAGGFAEAVPRAGDAGCNWVWIMDDDVRPKQDCLEKLLEAPDDFAARMPVRVNEQGENRELTSIEYDLHSPFRLDPHKLIVYEKYKTVAEMPEQFEVQNFPFEGPLIRTDLIQQIGIPDASYFILGDDIDYALRLRKHTGTRILMIREALLYRMIDGNVGFVYNWNSFKAFCLIRNMCRFSFLFGENALVRHLRPLLYVVQIALSQLKRGNLPPTGAIQILHAWFDSRKKVMPKRYHP